ncbi:MAG: chloride channel protein [Oscillospiraceae bacterium]|nr:chloride channel protein [Oscillospiraceae bacterium]
MKKILTKTLKLFPLALVLGFFGGAVGSLFHLAVDYVTEVREGAVWLIWLLPVAGVCLALLYLAVKRFAPLDTDRVIRSAQGEEEVPVVMAPVIFLATVVSHLFGASVGREGAALQLGGSLGSTLGRALKLGTEEKRIIVMAGMAAVFSALFGTPLAAAFFAIEVAVVGNMRYSALLPCILSSFVAYEVAHWFGVPPVRFDAVVQPELSLMLIVQVTVLAVLCAGVDVLFCSTIRGAEHLGEKYLKHPVVRAAVGGAVLVAFTCLVGSHDYNGAGTGVIEAALAGEAHYEAFLLKILFTAISIAAGFKGGEIVPTFFIGATFGCVAGGLLGMSPALGAAIGLSCMFCGVVNCPTASIFLAVELFGGSGVLMFTYACVIAYLFSGRTGLYKSQKVAKEI